MLYPAELRGQRHDCDRGDAAGVAARRLDGPTKLGKLEQKPVKVAS